MASDYSQTKLPFHDFPLTDLRDPVLSGPGSGGIEDAAAAYARLAEMLQTSADDLRAALALAQEVHEGDAAEAGRQYVARLSAAGEVGAAQARLVANGLLDQAGYQARVRADMGALSVVAPKDQLASVSPEEYARAAEQSRVLAVEAAQRYENNTTTTSTRCSSRSRRLRGRWRTAARCSPGRCRLGVAGPVSPPASPRPSARARRGIGSGRCVGRGRKSVRGGDEVRTGPPGRQVAARRVAEPGHRLVVRPGTTDRRPREFRVGARPAVERPPGRGARSPGRTEHRRSRRTADPACQPPLGTRRRAEFASLTVRTSRPP